MDFIAFLKELLGCEEQDCSAVTQELSNTRTELAKCRGNLTECLRKKGYLEEAIKGRDKTIADLSARLDTLSTWQDEPESKVPDWLRNDGSSYKGVRQSNEKGKTVSVKINPADLYFPRDSLIRLVARYGWKKMPHDQKLLEIWKYVIRRISYRYDATENWQEPNTTNDLKLGDCFAWYEEIYTKDGIKKIEEVKEGDLVLSYDFDKQEFVYKPVAKKWYKGKLQINRVHFRNGTWMDVSENHPMWVRTSPKESKYEKKYLSDIDLTKWYARKVPIARRLPREIIDKPEVTEDLAFVIGYFLAEGSLKHGKQITMSGYEMPEFIYPILENAGFTFYERHNNSGVPEIRLEQNWFTDLLREFTTGEDSLSFAARIPEWVFHLPDSKLRAILEGYLLGDGTKKLGKNPGGKEYILSTSSYELAMDLQRIALHLGFSFHIWKQEHHGGAGHRPIYRLTMNKNSHFLKDYGYKDISEVSISYIEKLDPVDMYDLTVADTHTVVMRSGIITHQCEDGTILFVTLARIAGVPADKVFNALGWFYSADGRSKFGHSFPIAQMTDGKWYIFESTLDVVPKFPKLFKGSNYDAAWGVHNWKYDGQIIPDSTWNGKKVKQI